MTEVYSQRGVTVYRGDCLDVLRQIPSESISAICTDPPYGLSNLRPDAISAALVAWANGDRERVPDARGFMGRAWDAFVPPPAVWDECLRVLKPGGHLVAFSGSRTYDLMGLSIRLAGFEIRDGLMWVYGSGMPKSLDVSKAIDKIGGVHPDWKPDAYAAAVERSGMTHADVDRHLGIKASSCYWARSDHRAAVPLYEHWVKARDFLGLDDTFTAIVGAADRPDRIVSGPAANVVLSPTVRVVAPGTPATSAAARWQGWGTALKPAHEPMVLARRPLVGTVARNVLAHGTGGLNIDATRVGGEGGRWPANVILDEHAAAALDAQSGTSKSDNRPRMTTNYLGAMNDDAWVAQPVPRTGYDDQGGASRFFYCAKAPQSERPKIDGQGWPTVKPLTLMRWVVRLVTPPGGTVLDPFAGTGTTLQAAEQEGMHAIGIERDELALRLIAARLGHDGDELDAPDDEAYLFDLPA